jgi:hypothetical protein
LTFVCNIKADICIKGFTQAEPVGGACFSIDSTVSAWRELKEDQQDCLHSLKPNQLVARASPSIRQWVRGASSRRTSRTYKTSYDLTKMFSCRNREAPQPSLYADQQDSTQCAAPVYNIPMPPHELQERHRPEPLPPPPPPPPKFDLEELLAAEVINVSADRRERGQGIPEENLKAQRILCEVLLRREENMGKRTDFEARTTGNAGAAGGGHVGRGGRRGGAPRPPPFRISRQGQLLARGVSISICVEQQQTFTTVPISTRRNCAGSALQHGGSIGGRLGIWEHRARGHCR